MESGGLKSMGSQRLRHDLGTKRQLLFFFFFLTLQYCVGFPIYQHDPPQVYTCSPRQLLMEVTPSIPSLPLLLYHQLEAGFVHSLTF